LPHLALRAGLSCRRVYELVKAGKIPSEKKGATRAVDAETAQKLVKEKNERRRIRDLIQEVIQRGVKKDAVRKRVYRLRRAGRTDAEIAQELLKLLM
jgi:L-serine deaminase